MYTHTHAHTLTVKVEYVRSQFGEVRRGEESSGNSSGPGFIVWGDILWPAEETGASSEPALAWCFSL